MPTTSAVTADLDGYVAATTDGTARLTATAADVRSALDTFRGSEGRAAFLADVPEADLDVTFLALRWQRLGGWLDAVARAFRAADDGEGGDLVVDDGVLASTAPRWAPPEVEVLARDGRLVLDTGAGDDDVWVVDQGGELVVVVNGRSYTFASSSGDLLLRTGAGADEVGDLGLAAPPTRDGFTVDGGAGDDHIWVAGGAAVVRGGRGRDVIRGGAGDDRLLGGDEDDTVTGGGGDDRIIGGEGDDVIDGHDGDDHISGGAGSDLIYGEDGSDILSGGDGRDHVDGGFGDDAIDGGAGHDVLSGGMDDDVLSGDHGADVVYAGPGEDGVHGGKGHDELHVEPGDGLFDSGTDDVRRETVDLTLLAGFTIDPPSGPAHDRILSDLVTLASTRTGARLLEALRGEGITVATQHPDTGALPTDAYAREDDTVVYSRDDDEAGFGRDPGSNLSYSPLVALHHELVHAYDDTHGTTVEGVYLGEDQDQIPRVLDVEGVGGGSRRRVILDRDGDGAVDAEELSVLDADGDGELSEGELDINGDGHADLGDGWTTNAERATVGLSVDDDQDPTTPDVDRSAGGGRRPGLDENTMRDELQVPIRDRY